jgi:hypothetical protein
MTKSPGPLKISSFAQSVMALPNRRLKPTAADATTSRRS